MYMLSSLTVRHTFTSRYEFLMDEVCDNISLPRSIIISC